MLRRGPSPVARPRLAAWVYREAERQATGLAALTNAERQVFQLVGARLSNQEIAERLFVSRRTVETHVSHALAKLGCTTRRELIAAVRALGDTQSYG